MRVFQKIHLFSNFILLIVRKHNLYYFGMYCSLLPSTWGKFSKFPMHAQKKCIIYLLDIILKCVSGVLLYNVLLYSFFFFFCLLVI